MELLLGLGLGKTVTDRSLFYPLFHLPVAAFDLAVFVVRVLDVVWVTFHKSRMIFWQESSPYVISDVPKIFCPGLVQIISYIIKFWLSAAVECHLGKMGLVLELLGITWDKLDLVVLKCLHWVEMALKLSVTLCSSLHPIKNSPQLISANIFSHPVVFLVVLSCLSREGVLRYGYGSL